MLDLLLLAALVIVGTPVFGLVVYGIIAGGALLEWLAERLVYGSEAGPLRIPSARAEQD